MLNSAKGIIPLKDFRFGAKLTDFFSHGSSMLTRSIEGKIRRVVYVWEATREVVVPSSRNGRKGSNPDRDRTRAGY